MQSAVYEMIDTLCAHLEEHERKNLDFKSGYECLNPDSKKHRCQECQPCVYYAMLNFFTQRNTESLVKCEFPLHSVIKFFSLGLSSY